MSPFSHERRRTLALLAALAAGGRVFGQRQGNVSLRTDLERTYVTWLQAMRSRDVSAFAAQTSQYRQMCLKNEIVSLGQEWPMAVFKSVIQAPDISRLTFVDAAEFGDAARAVYFGRVDFALDSESPVTPENPLVVRFLREGGVWKFDWIQYVNLGTDEDTRREAKSGGRKWLESEEFQLTGRYPAIPRPCKKPYQIAALSILARSCKVTVDVNQGAHIETVENNTGGRIITGGLQRGPNLLTITPVPDARAANASQLEIHILTRAETWRPAVKLWSWKPPQPNGQWLPKYEASVFVKSRVAVR
jgi:hypothetical protein